MICKYKGCQVMISLKLASLQQITLHLTPISFLFSKFYISEYEAIHFTMPNIVTQCRKEREKDLAATT